MADHREQDAGHHFVGVAAALVDLHAGVSAAQAGDDHLESLVALRHGGFLVFEGDVGVETAGAAHVELAFRLGVEVEQDLALEDTGLEGLGTDHPSLLIHGE